MALKDIFTMVKADRYTQDGREEIIKAQEAETKDARRTYQIGEISEATGLQKTANGWRPVKKGAETSKGKEGKPAANHPSMVIPKGMHPVEFMKAWEDDAQKHGFKKGQGNEWREHLRNEEADAKKQNAAAESKPAEEKKTEEKQKSWGTPSNPSENVKHLKDPNPGIPSQENDIAINGKAYKAHLGDTILTKSGQKYEYAGKTSTGKIRVTSREGSTPITTAIDEKEILGLSEPENMSPKEKAALKTAEENKPKESRPYKNLHISELQSQVNSNEGKNLSGELKANHEEQKKELERRTLNVSSPKKGIKKGDKVYNNYGERGTVLAASDDGYLYIDNGRRKEWMPEENFEKIAQDSAPRVLTGDTRIRVRK